jgi:hypothetical protein
MPSSDSKITWDKQQQKLIKFFTRRAVWSVVKYKFAYFLVIQSVFFETTEINAEILIHLRNDTREWLAAQWRNSNF